MSAIKKFFQKKKMDIKFKKAGAGHKLTDDTRSAKSTDPGPSRPVYVKQASSEAANKAREAALNRVTSPRPGTASGNSSIKAQARREVEAEKKAMLQAQMKHPESSAPTEIVQDSAPVLSVNGIFYKCPLLGPEVLPKTEMEVKIEEFLLNQLSEEPQMASALMIHTFNKDPEKVRVCCETLLKILTNIIENPSDEKFRKVRIGSKVFQEKIAPLKGTDEFLQSGGFVVRKQPFQDSQADFYVLTEESASDVDQLRELKGILQDAEAIKPELDHNMKVFYQSARATQFDIPDEFYNITPDEIKREQQARTEAVEKLGMLRTKEMRERDRQRALRRYRYTLLRIRLPDGLIMQGTFRAMDKLSSVMTFVREALAADWMPFILSTSTGQRLNEEESRLAELELVPAAVLNLAFDPTIMAEIVAHHGTHQSEPYLKQEIMACIETL